MEKELCDSAWGVAETMLALYRAARAAGATESETISILTAIYVAQRISRNMRIEQQKTAADSREQQP